MKASMSCPVCRRALIGYRSRKPVSKTIIRPDIILNVQGALSINFTLSHWRSP